MKPGTRIRLKAKFDWQGERPHLAMHARHGHIGTVAEREKQNPKMADLYIIAKFSCGHEHRLLAKEVEIVSKRPDK